MFAFLRRKAPEPKRQRESEECHSGVETTPLLSEPVLSLESESGNHAVPTDTARVRKWQPCSAVIDLTDDGIDSDEVGAGEIEQVPFLYMQLWYISRVQRKMSW